MRLQQKPTLTVFVYFVCFLFFAPKMKNKMHDLKVALRQAKVQAAYIKTDLWCDGHESFK